MNIQLQSCLQCVLSLSLNYLYCSRFQSSSLPYIYEEAKHIICREGNSASVKTKQKWQIIYNIYINVHLKIYIQLLTVTFEGVICYLHKQTAVHVALKASSGSDYVT